MNKGYTEIDSKFYKEVSLVMLPTEKAENCLITKQGNGHLNLEYHKQYFTKDYLQSIYAKAYHLYFLSDEEIKEGDYVINTMHNAEGVSRIGHSFAGEISLNYVQARTDRYKKIIATTDSELGNDNCLGRFNPKTYGHDNEQVCKEFCPQCRLPKPSNSFTEKFVIEWNKSNKIDKVLVEMESYCKYGHSCPSEGDFSKQHLCDVNYKLKIAPDNTITIKQLVVKDSWNREEIKALFIKKFEAMMPKLEKIDDFKGNNIYDAIHWAECKAEQRERQIYLRAISELDEFIKQNL